jgi:hypothetical protein
VRLPIPAACKAAIVLESENLSGTDSMNRREISTRMLLGSAAAATLAVPAATAQSEGRAHYPRTPEETAANVTPGDDTYQPGDVRSYGAVGDWGASAILLNAAGDGSTVRVASFSS